MNSLDIRPKGLFLNPTKANCSIHESGRMMYECLALSRQYDIEYLEIDDSSRGVPGNYDFYAFNYHHVTMNWLDLSSLQKLPGLKITFVLETLTNDPFVLCPSDAFDVYCALDPTMNVADKRVYAFPRPLEAAPRVTPYREKEIPVIGSFGFATPGKGFELVIDAVNKEFERAIVRINIPSGTYSDPATFALHGRDYPTYLANLCQKVAKKGVEVVVTRDYMSKDELIEWCGQNTLNCFLYNRNQPGLSATTDQAISSGRPLAVSDNETFRHIHSYLEPYPFVRLRESIAKSEESVLKMQSDWQPLKFAEKFEEMLRERGLFSSPRPSDGYVEKIELKPLSQSFNARVVRKVKWIAAKRAAAKTSTPPDEKALSPMRVTRSQENHGNPTILLVSHAKSQCGIQQYGLNIAKALGRSRRFYFAYAECSSGDELRVAVERTQPAAIIYNHYPLTMPWLTPQITRSSQVPQLGIMHEVTQQEADDATNEMFDYHLCPDPTLEERNPLVFKTRRLIPAYINTTNIPDVVTIGSFGFGFADKGFERLINTVQKEFDEARIVLRLPFNDLVDKNGRSHALGTARRCRRLVTKPKIKLVIEHDFLTKPQLLDFLAANTINCFFYDTHKDRGISSTIEHALAVQRPLAITKSGMFRHVSGVSPSICIEDSSLKQIIENGIAPLVPFYNEWSEPSFILGYEAILNRVLDRTKATTMGVKA